MADISFKNISKHFGKFSALDNVSFSIGHETVHCILGENGAGKSTLMKILFGMYQPDSGVIKIGNDEVRFNTPHDAIDMGIGMIHQHFMLIDDFTVLENIILGEEKTSGIKTDFRKAAEILNSIINKYNLNLDLNRKIFQLEVSMQQKVEILKLLYRNAEILILDEPTAVLSPPEIENLFKIIEEFKQDGKTIILITHKLAEVRKIADAVTVLRRGKNVFEQSKDAGELDVKILSRAIVGEVKINELPKRSVTVKEPEEILELRNVRLEKDGVKILNDLNLALFKGEVHGICGVEGNGQQEIVEIISGIEKNFEGEIVNKAEKIALVPDDRIRKGFIKEFSVGENIILKNSSAFFISAGKTLSVAREVEESYDVRTPDLSSPMGSLSGGNQQKVILAREINYGGEIIILSHPARGVDLNATLFIHSKIIVERNKGKAILLISSDLDELLSLSDRLSVIYRGKIIKTFGRGEFEDESSQTELTDVNSSKKIFEKLGSLMTGITVED